MPYEIDKTFVISQKMIDKAKANGTLYVDNQHNLLIDRIREALKSRYVRNTAETITVRMIPYLNGLPLSPEADGEKSYYMPHAVAGRLDRWAYQKSKAQAANVPFEPDCSSMRFTLRLNP
jgi:hypothetical protein